MARKLNALISKIEKALGTHLPDFRSGLEPTDRAERILGFVVSSDFEGMGHRDRQSRLKSVLEKELTRDELRLLGPIVTMTPVEAEVEWTWERLLRLWEAVVERVGSFSEHDDPQWWMRSTNT